MGAQVGGFDITMSGNGETLCLEWVRDYFTLKKICINLKNMKKMLEKIAILLNCYLE
jgi:hypothetical protein